MFGMVLALIVAAEAPPATAQIAVAEPDPKTMSQKEIRAFNAKLPRNHPYYIRCVRDGETGSLAKRLYSCRTNEQWEKAFVTGNDNARKTIDDMRGKAVTNF